MQWIFNEHLDRDREYNHSLTLPFPSTSVNYPVNMENAKTQARYRFLEHLPPPPCKYKYSGFQCLEEAVNEECRCFLDETWSPCIIFTDFPHPEIRNHEERFPEKFDYDPTLQLLILTTLFTPHEAAAKYLATALRPKLEMGIFDALAFKGGTRVKSPGREKQSGRSWAPQDLPPGRSYQWPTVALEEAFSESREQVKQDVV